MARTNPHQIAWTATGLRRAAAEVGVTLPVAYSQAVAADGLRREPTLGVTRLGDGVVLHTSPEDDRHLPVVQSTEPARTTHGIWTPPTPLLTTDQAAQYLQVSVRTVKNLMGDGRVAYVKIGRVTRIHRQDLDEYIARNRRKHRSRLRAS
ncbi:MAG: helix-turn-helix domain-containing protein [Acidimicrobiales bacterium]